MKNPWISLAIFALAAALSQALWLNFGPLLSEIQKIYHVSEDTAGWLLMVFPLIYVLISIPTGKFVDRQSYKKSLVLGTAMMALGALIRIYVNSFAVLLAAQVIIAIAQPFIINSISKLVLDSFEKSQEALATGLGTMGMFIGMALGLMVTPIMYEKLGLQTTMATFFLLSFVSFLLCSFGLKNLAGKTLETTSTFAEIKAFLKDRNLFLIFLIAFLGLGFFNGITTWLEPILAPYTINSVQAGVVGGALILGGIVGAALIPAFSDYFRRRKPFVLVGLAAATATLWPLSHSGDYKKLLILAALQGFFFLPAFSIVLQMCSEYVGQARAGVATGVLMLLGNAGGVLVIIAMESLKTPAGGFEHSLQLLLACLIAGIILTAFTKETAR